MLPLVNYILDNYRVKTTLSLALLSLLSFADNAAHAAEPALVPIEHFVEEQTYSSPRLSPDGKHIAINVRLMRNGRMVPTMSIFTLPQLKNISVIALPGFQIPLDFEWITNSRLVLEKGMEVGLRVEPAYTGEVVAVDIDGGRQAYLYGADAYSKSAQGARYGDDYGSGFITHIPEKRNGHVYLSTHLWDSKRSMLYDIDSFTSTRKLLADIPVQGMTFHVQNNDKPRFATGSDEQTMPVLYRLDDASGQWRKQDMSAVGSRYAPFAFTPDDSAVYVSYSATGGPQAILREELATGKRTPVASDPLANIGSLQFSALPSVPFAVASAVGVPRARYIDENHRDAKLHKTLSASFPEAIVSFINFSDDGEKLLFGVSSDRDPGSYYLYDRKTGDAALLFSNMENIDPDQMAERQPITFTASDGLTLTGYLTKPRNAGKQKLPMVLLPHGGPFGIQDDWFFDTDAQFLANRGYAVLQVNFRGSGGRGVNFTEAGYRQYGGKMMDDLIEGVKWANKLPEIDANRVCVYGISFGGYAALMLPVRAPGMFKCAVGYSGRYDLPSRFTQHGASSNAKRTKNFLLKTVGDDLALLEKQSPTNLADQIKVKVLLAHGGNDKVTLPDQAIKMRDALREAHNSAEWIFEKEEGHGFYDAQRRKAFYERLELFLNTHIGKDAKAPDAG
jgi:dipeptidyl aminopeptidase/acylaminoacyl peptidase